MSVKKKVPNIVTYLDDLVEGELKFKDDPLWWHKKGLSFTTSGFGSKIPTERKVQFGNRWYRVYCIIYSNSGSLYIESKGKRLYIR